MNIVTYLHLHCEFHNFLFVRPNQQLAAKKRVVVNLHESITFLKDISIFFLSCDEFHIYTNCMVCTSTELLFSAFASEKSIGSVSVGPFKD